MTPFQDLAELRALLDALCEESITPEQVGRLEELVLAHPEAEENPGESGVRGHVATHRDRLSRRGRMVDRDLDQSKHRGVKRVIQAMHVLVIAIGRFHGFLPAYRVIDDLKAQGIAAKIIEFPSATERLEAVDHLGEEPSYIPEHGRGT